MCRQLILRSYLEVAIQWRRPGAEFGGTDKIFRCPTFLNDVFFRKNIFTFRVKISDFFFFFSHRPGFSDFPFLFPDFPYLYYVKCRIRPFPHLKNNFLYSVHTFTCIRQHYFSKYLGDQCMGRPPPQIFLGPSPQSLPRSPPLTILHLQ